MTEQHEQIMEPIAEAAGSRRRLMPPPGQGLVVASPGPEVSEAIRRVRQACEPEEVERAIPFRSREDQGIDPSRSAVRSEHRSAARMLRENAGLVIDLTVGEVWADAGIGSAAQRLRAATRGPRHTMPTVISCTSGAGGSHRVVTVPD